MMIGCVAENHASGSNELSPPRKKRRFGNVLDDNDQVSKTHSIGHLVTQHEPSGKENETISKEKYLAAACKESFDIQNLEGHRIYPKTMHLLRDLQSLDQSFLHHMNSMMSSLKHFLNGAQDCHGLLEECLQAVRVVDGMDNLVRSHDGKPKSTRKPLTDHNAYYIDNKFFFEKL
ncbi:unnamed protein product [Meganyctiphanes norvegica]|uniref:Uncharacterized protein n=1 Tax=Meganyctiphanes norvegica TaxID=48144 RepID=A0AAV2S7Q3_MEGNR